MVAQGLLFTQLSMFAVCFLAIDVWLRSSMRNRFSPGFPATPNGIRIYYLMPSEAFRAQNWANLWARNIEYILCPAVQLWVWFGNFCFPVEFLRIQKDIEESYTSLLNVFEKCSVRFVYGPIKKIGSPLVDLGLVD